MVSYWLCLQILGLEKDKRSSLLVVRIGNECKEVLKPVSRKLRLNLEQKKIQQKCLFLLQNFLKGNHMSKSLFIFHCSSKK